MKSYEEMAQNVFRRGDEYLRKKEKRAAAMEKGVSFMSVFSMLTLVGLGLWNSNVQNPVTPENTNEIAIIETVSATEAQSAVILSSSAEKTAASTELAAESSTTAETTVTAVTSSAAAPVMTAAVTTEPAATTIAVTTKNAVTDTVTQTSTSQEQTDVPATTTGETVTTTLPAVTDSDENKVNVVSVSEDCIISELASGTAFDYITYYRGFLADPSVYLWGTETTNFYAVTAATNAELQNFLLPDGAEIVDLNALSSTLPSWGEMEQKLCLDDLTDPYIIVNGADPQTLYQMGNVKGVYQLDLYRCTEAYTVETTGTNRIIVIFSEEISLEEPGVLTVDGEDLLVQDIEKVYDMENGQTMYALLFEQSEAAEPDSELSLIQKFDLCHKLLDFRFIDAAYPDVMYLENIPDAAYTATLIENTNIVKSSVLGDVDMDGVLTGHDAAMVSRYVREEGYALTEEQIALADINGDGAVTDADADEIYAKKTIYLGDADGDGKSYPGMTDASITLRACAPFYEVEITPEFLARADVDADGLITFYDMKLMLCTYTTIAAQFNLDYAESGYYFHEAAFPDSCISFDTTLVLGDVDNDSLLTIRDVVFTEHFLETGSMELAHRIYQADMNLDAVINEADLAIMRENALDFGCDIDMDGAVNLDDATAALKMYALKAAGDTDKYRELQMFNAYTDVNRDGTADISDATEILTQYAESAAGLA